MNNSRFRKLTPEATVEMIATRIQFDYQPNGLTTPESLKATWWGREFIPVGDGYQTLGEGGRVIETVLADHAATVLTITDPVTQQTMDISAAAAAAASGAVTWLMAFYDHAYNQEFPAAPVEPGPEP